MDYKYGYMLSHSRVYWYFLFRVLSLDDSTLKGAVYITLWAIFYAVTTITYYVRYGNRKKK